MTIADKIRTHAREKYALPARHKKAKRFSIKAGDVVHELKIAGYAPAVCSALKTREFLRENELRLVGTELYMHLPDGAGRSRRKGPNW